jgi:hypothetical protein
MVVILDFIPTMAYDEISPIGWAKNGMLFHLTFGTSLSEIQ